MKRNNTMKMLGRMGMLLFVAVFALSSCGTKKNIESQGDSSAAVGNVAATDAALLSRVNAVSITTGDIVADMKFSLEMGSKSISAPGSLHMRRNEIIRIQVFVPLLGSEVGRIDFTPNKVLVVDRLHKEYLEADYTKVGFLSRNNIDFNTLQALFWDNLLVPGKSIVDEDNLGQYTLNGLKTAGMLDIALSDGKMNYEWSANKLSCLIEKAVLSYASQTKGTSTVKCSYADFQKVGKKQFPTTIVFEANTSASGKQRSGKVSMKLNSVSTDSKWDTTTELSDKYKKMESSDLFGKLLNM